MKPSVKQWLSEQMPGMEDEMYEEIYSEYKATSQRLLGELKEKRAAKAAFEVTDKIAHTMKGDALMVGDQETFDVVQAWREATRLGNTARADELFPEICRLVEAL